MNVAQPTDFPLPHSGTVDQETPVAVARINDNDVLKGQFIRLTSWKQYVTFLRGNAFTNCMDNKWFNFFSYTASVCYPAGSYLRTFKAFSYYVRAALIAKFLTGSDDDVHSLH